MSLAYWGSSIVVNTLPLFDKVNRHWTRLLLAWETVYGQVNHLGIWPRSTQPSALHVMEGRG